ncbi:hypothetical protein BDR22DRAFT_960085 [Usnea florida]
MAAPRFTAKIEKSFKEFIENIDADNLELCHLSRVSIIYQYVDSNSIVDTVVTASATLDLPGETGDRQEGGENEVHFQSVRKALEDKIEELTILGIHGFERSMSKDDVIHFVIPDRDCHDSLDAKSRTDSTRQTSESSWRSGYVDVPKEIKEDFAH